MKAAQRKALTKLIEKTQWLADTEDTRGERAVELSAMLDVVEGMRDDIQETLDELEDQDSDRACDLQDEIDALTEAVDNLSHAAEALEDNELEDSAELCQSAFDTLEEIV